jgi:hypothetical protein
VGPIGAATVRLTGVPARLFVESQDQQHDLIRELALIDIRSRYHDDSGELPARIADLISDILNEYQDVRSVTREQAVEALAIGNETLTIAVPVRPGMVDALRRWLRLVEEADAVCEGGALLTLAARPEVRALRRWYVEAITGAVTAAAPEVAYPADAMA